MSIRYFGLVLFFFLGGCLSTEIPPGNVNVVVADLNAEAAHAAWGRVLESSVDWRGRIDFKKIARNPDDLYLYVSYVGKVSPKTSPELFFSLEDQLAHYINSYNALVMVGIIQNKFPRNFSSSFMRTRFFKHDRFLIGGETISLSEYVDKIIRPAGDPLIHFALSDMVVSGPELPREPFNGEFLHGQLHQAAGKFINNPMNVQSIEAEGLLRLSEKFRDYEEDFVNYENYPSIVSFLNQHLDRKIEGEVRIEYLPYDWTIKYS